MYLKLLDGPTSEAKLEIQILSWKLPIFRTLCGPKKTYLWAIYTLSVIMCYSDLNLTYQLASPLLHQVFLLELPHRGCLAKPGKSASKFTRVALWRPQGFIPLFGAPSWLNVRTTWWLAPTSSCDPRESEGENGQDRSLDVFYNPILELAYHHFCSILFIT